MLADKSVCMMLSKFAFCRSGLLVLLGLSLMPWITTSQLLSKMLALGVATGVLITGAGMVSLADVSRTEFSPIFLMCWFNFEFNSSEAFVNFSSNCLSLVSSAL